MAPKKKAAAKPSVAEESTQPSVDESVASTPLTPSVDASPPAKGRKSTSAAPATPSESAAPAPVSADPSPSPGGRRRKPEAAAAATTAADDVAAAASPKPRKDKAPPAFVDVLVADNVAPAALGIVDMALSRDENLVAAARSNGSLAVYRVLPGPDPEKPIFNFVMTANTGGHTNCGIVRVSFLGESDEFIVATLWSGQIALYHAVSLAVISVSARVGGVIRSIARSGPRDFFGACADGSARRYQLTPANDGIQVVLTLPKNVSCERALSVAVDVALGLVVVGDDARTVTAFELGAVGAKHLSQRWHMQLPNGYPMAIAMSAAGNAIAIGTSLNEVLFVDPSIGLVVNTFQHHKGPVTVLIEAAGVFYASGWHESLRAYRSASASSKNGAKPTPATRANAKASAADYCPAEVKRRTHYHECVALAVGIKTDLFLSAARDGTIMFTNLPKLFTHPASYLDSQVSKTPYELCGSGHLLFTHREAVVQVFRVLPTQLLPLASISLSGEFNVRGLWPNEDGTRLCVATDDRLLVLAVDANLETNTCVIRRLVQEPIGEIASACFVSKDVCCASVGSQILVIACDNESVTAAADATKRLHNMRRKQAVQHRRGNAEALAEVAYQTTSVKQVYTSPRIQGYIHSMAEANVPVQQCIFVATSAPAAYHFIRFDRSEPYKLVDPPSYEATDCVAVRKMQAAGEVAFLCPTDGRHWVAKAPLVTNRVAELLTKKPTSLTVARALLPQNAVALGRYPENPTMCAAAFPGGIVQFQANGERWSYIRQADRAKADAHNIKTKTEFAAFVPSNSAAVPPWAAQLDTKGHLGLVRKTHRAEAATIALAGEDSDAEGSDDGRGEDPAQLAEGVTKGAKRSDAVFVLRRNVDGLLDGLPNMWRVRRFGN